MNLPLNRKENWREYNKLTLYAHNRIGLIFKHARGDQRNLHRTVQLQAIGNIHFF